MSAVADWYTTRSADHESGSGRRHTVRSGTNVELNFWISDQNTHTHTHTHTHTFNGPFLGLPRWAGTRKVKPIWILLKQQTVSGSGFSWAICKSAPRSIQITMPATHHSFFYRPDALPAAQPTASKHWSHEHWRHMYTNTWWSVTLSVIKTKTCNHLNLNLKYHTAWSGLLTEHIFRIVSVFQSQHMSDLVIFINNVQVTDDCWMILQSRHLSQSTVHDVCFHYTLQLCHKTHFNYIRQLTNLSLC